MLPIVRTAVAPNVDNERARAVSFSRPDRAGQAARRRRRGHRMKRREFITLLSGAAVTWQPTTGIVLVALPAAYLGPSRSPLQDATGAQPSLGRTGRTDREIAKGHPGA